MQKTPSHGPCLPILKALSIFMVLLMKHGKANMYFFCQYALLDFMSLAQHIFFSWEIMLFRLRMLVVSIRIAIGLSPSRNASTGGMENAWLYFINHVSLLPDSSETLVVKGHSEISDVFHYKIFLSQSI